MNCSHLPYLLGPCGNQLEAFLFQQAQRLLDGAALRLPCCCFSGCEPPSFSDKMNVRFFLLSFQLEARFPLGSGLFS